MVMLMPLIMALIMAMVMVRVVTCTHSKSSLARVLKD
jgi:hypothetical protein